MACMGHHTCVTSLISFVGHLHLIFYMQKELNNKLIVEIRSTSGTLKAGHLGVIQTTTVQENQWVTWSTTIIWLPVVTESTHAKINV